MDSICDSDSISLGSASAKEGWGLEHDQAATMGQLTQSSQPEVWSLEPKQLAQQEGHLPWTGHRPGFNRSILYARPISEQSQE